MVLAPDIDVLRDALGSAACHQALSILAETLTFTLVAPILMLFHTKFVVLTLCRQTISWGSQRRGGAGESAWREAMAAHAGQTLFGLGLAALVVRMSPALAWWMSPLLAGMLLSIPISYLTGSAPLGQRLRAWGLFRTPEETNPGPELQRLSDRVAAPPRANPPRPELVPHYGLLQAVLDPYVNATHVSLLRAKDATPGATELRLSDLREKLLEQGPDALTSRDRFALLSDLDSMVALHETVWAAPSSRLAQWWRVALQHYHLVAPPPQTAQTLSESW